MKKNKINENKKSIITPKVTSTERVVDYNRKMIMRRAKEFIKEKKCPRCSRINWRIVPLFEYGDPYMPSSVVLFCHGCGKYNETFAKAPDKQARAYAESLKRQGFKAAPDSAADTLIKP